MQQKPTDLLESIQKSMQLLAEQISQKGTRPVDRAYKKTPDNPTFTRGNTSKYCWTHGGCSHNSNECTRKAPGHKNDATKDVKLGGLKPFVSDQPIKILLQQSAIVIK